MTQSPPRCFFRILTTMSPTRVDLLSHHERSHHERGIRPRRPLTARDRDRWHGLSMFGSYQAASVKSQESPWLGEYVAEVLIPPGALVRIEQAGRDLARFTVWATADDLAAWVRSVQPVADVQ